MSEQKEVTSEEFAVLAETLSAIHMQKQLTDIEKEKMKSAWAELEGELKELRELKKAIMFNIECAIIRVKNDDLKRLKSAVLVNLNSKISNTESKIKILKAQLLHAI